MQTLAICSGGLDSVVLSHLLDSQQQLGHLLSFDYGQRHKKELSFAKLCADRLNVPHTVIDISEVGKAISNSALTGDIDVPDGHYAADNMKVTIVPNRNAIMLTIAFGMAANLGYDAVTTAVHGGDHFIYPDCRESFINSFASMQKHALADYAEIELSTPFINRSKSEIVKVGDSLNVPFQSTWSCYKGEKQHCGRCGTCVERQEAFALAQVSDPTPYRDSQFWQQQSA